MPLLKLWCPRPPDPHPLRKRGSNFFGEKHLLHGYSGTRRYGGAAMLGEEMAVFKGLSSGQKALRVI